jgi:peptidyl-dipeptidase Dcp
MLKLPAHKYINRVNSFLFSNTSRFFRNPIRFCALSVIISQARALSTLTVEMSVTSTLESPLVSTLHLSHKPSFQSENPLLERSFASQPHGLPPFQKFKPELFPEAFSLAMNDHLEEIEFIANNEAPPTFSNVVEALDIAGGLLDDVSRVFGVLCASVTNDELQAIERDIAPKLAAHSQRVYANTALFAKLDAVYSARETLSLNSEQLRLLERIHLDFVRAGAKFDEEKKKSYKEIVTRLAELQTQFSQNVLGDETEFTIKMSLEDLAGCPHDLIAAARQASIERGGAEGEYVITLSRSLVEPFLTFSTRRDLREKAWRAWTKRGELSEKRDNLAVAGEMLRLRSKQASMHGHESFAAYQHADTMAKTPEAVLQLLQTVWPKAKIAAEKERAALAEYAARLSEGSNSIKQVEPWDWRFIAEKVRSERFNFDESALKPFLSLDKVTEAIFDCAFNLFGLRFVHKPELTSFHSDAKVYEVYEGSKLVAIFVHDNFARKGKIGGAWMSELRTQTSNGNSTIPIITNNNNFSRGETVTLLSWDDAITAFHEFGHGLHGMLSNVRYKSLAGTSVLRDFVELPSQLFEHWLSEPEVMKKHLKHHETGEVIPDDLIAKMKAARAFNQGFATIEYTASALVDQVLHALTTDKLKEGVLDLKRVEEESLAELGMPQGIIMRHRPAHFSHLFSSSSYAAAYYCYLWAEVLDADAFDAFKESGNGCFDKATAERLRACIYSTGNSVEPGEAFRKFRGRDPVVEPMLKKKGLM